MIVIMIMIIFNHTKTHHESCRKKNKQQSPNLRMPVESFKSNLALIIDKKQL